MPRPLLKKVKRTGDAPNATSTPVKKVSENARDRLFKESPEVARRAGPMGPVTGIAYVEKDQVKDDEFSSPHSSMGSTSSIESSEARASPTVSKSTRPMAPMDTNSLTQLLPRRRVLDESEDDSDQETCKRKTRRVKQTARKDNQGKDSDEEPTKENRDAIRKKFEEIDKWQLDMEDVSVSTSSS